MWQVWSLLALVGVAPDASSADKVIAVPEVEVRSGPSPKYYATGKLKQGDRVKVIFEKNGFLAIEPPPGSFSLIRKSAVRQLGSAYIVSAEKAETIVGSTLPVEQNALGRDLPLGFQLILLDETRLLEGRELASYYKIKPIGEVRYVPVEAVKAIEPPAASEPTPTPVPPGAPSFPPAPDLPEKTPPPPPAEPLTDLQRAEQAYQQGDWVQAKALFQELALSPDQETRLLALNRLEFIRLRNQAAKKPPMATGDAWRAPSEPAAGVDHPPVAAPAAVTPRNSVPPGVAAQRPLPAAKSAYTHAVDANVARMTPAPQIPASPPPTNVETAATPAKAYLQPPAIPKATSPLEGGVAKLPGRLRHAHQRLEDRPLYILEDSAGELKCFVSPVAGTNLERHVDQAVEVEGSLIGYHTGLRGNVLKAVRAEPLTLK